MNDKVKASQEELDLLTDEERAALEEEDELSPEEVAAAAEKAKADAEAAAAAEAEAEAKKKQEEEDAAAAAAEAEKNKGGDDDQDDDAAKKPPRLNDSAPLLSGDLPEDVEKQLGDIAAKKAEADQQFDDGDLTTKEYRQKIDELSREERKIENAQFKASLANEMQASSARNAWIATVNDFIGDHAEYAPGSLRYQALDTMVKSIASKPENEQKTGAQILAMAHDAVIAELGAVQAPAPNDPPDDGNGRDAGDGKKPAIPPGLGKLPAAEHQDMSGNSKWKELDRLSMEDPEGYEEAIAKMSDADRDAYLASA